MPCDVPCVVPLIYQILVELRAGPRLWHQRCLFSVRVCVLCLYWCRVVPRVYQVRGVPASALFVLCLYLSSVSLLIILCAVTASVTKITMNDKRQGGTGSGVLLKFRFKAQASRLKVERSF